MIFSPSDVKDFTRFNVVSSRIRLARNVEGLPFPRAGKTAVPSKMLELVSGAEAAAESLFECELYLMSKLSKAQKTALIERHIISLPLANNTRTGAVIIERGNENMSIMLNEEDHIREQCVTDGFDLSSAYERIDRYDDKLIDILPIAYDARFGFLTACPTNLGTGMRASTMLFLPALKRAGAIEDALGRFTREYGLTVRGVYGEGSEAFADMYQLSNSRTLGVSEDTILKIVGQASAEMCYCERVAVQKLAKERGAELMDGVSRSYATLRSAYKLGSAELMKLIVDVKLGVILDVLPVKETRLLDKLALLCSPSSLYLKIGDRPPEERDVLRAKLVRQILSEEQ